MSKGRYSKYHNWERPDSAHDVPFDFNAMSYLQELSQQMPGMNGRYEICRQVADAIGCKNSYSPSYIQNLIAGRQPMTEHMRQALFNHSQGRFTRKLGIEDPKMTLNLAKKNSF